MMPRSFKDFFIFAVADGLHTDFAKKGGGGG